MNIAVYCSSSSNVTDAMLADADRLGRWIGTTGSTLVYGGIAAGLMERVARSVHETGGKIIGVVPRSRLGREYEFNTENRLVDGLHQRKEVMENIADVFVALPGGYGTLDEVVSTWASLGFNGVDKPIILLDTDGLYQPFAAQIRKMEEMNLLTSRNASRIIFAPTVDAVIELLEKQMKK